MTKFDSAAFVICCCVTVTLKKGVARLIKALAIYTYKGHGRVLIVGHKYLFTFHFLIIYGLLLLLSRGVLGLSLTLRIFFLGYY